ncbi:glycosyltransferase family 4 protein [Candidatus Peregrinibacteria bacterium]|nr:glycosyltransferase family 4 protein [Candidatus Peregrinibacteria bacterium]
MRITYVTQTRFPVPKAHGKQIAEVCAALAALGHKVTLVCPNVYSGVHRDAFSYYGIPKSFEVKRLDHFDASIHWWLKPLGFFHFPINMWRYKKALTGFLRTHKTDLFYVRASLLVPLLAKTGVPVILELHTIPKRRSRRFATLCNSCKKVVCLTHLMAHELRRRGIDRAKIVVEPDGVDLSRFRHVPSLKDAKKKAKNFPDDRPVVGYVGSFFTQRKIEKGVGVIIEALAILKRKNVPLYGLFAGGQSGEIEMYKRAARQKKIDRDVLFHGLLAAAEVPLQLAACDILIYPAPASKHPYFQRDTSPLKLFEYLATGRPIICADLPPLREVVDDRTVFFFTPGDATSLAHWIDHVLSRPTEAKKKAERGQSLVKAFDWKKRMERIMA